MPSGLRCCRRIHNRAEVFIMAQFSSPLTQSPRWKTKISETEPARPLISEHIENFTKDVEVRRDLGNRANPANRAHMERP